MENKAAVKVGSTTITVKQVDHETAAVTSGYGDVFYVTVWNGRIVGVELLDRAGGRPALSAEYSEGDVKFTAQQELVNYEMRTVAVGGAEFGTYDEE